MRSERRTRLAAIVAAIAVTGLCAALAPGQSRAATSERLPSIEGRTLLPGIMRARQDVALSAPLEGVLQRVKVREGEIVKAGQALATMDDRVARASVAVARLRAESRGDIRQAEAALEQATIEHERITRMHRSSAASDSELLAARTMQEQAEAAMQIANERLAVAQAVLAFEEQVLERHTIRAPFDGRVVRIQARAGETLTTSSTVLTLVSLVELEAELHLPLDLFGQLEEGRTYMLRAGRPVRTSLTAQLRTIDPVIDAASGTFRCVFSVENETQTLPAGFSVWLAETELARMTLAGAAD